MSSSRPSAGDRLVHALFACVLFLTILFLWQLTHERSCLALLFPVLTFFVVFCGLLEYKLERKRFVVAYYLDQRSALRRRLQSSALSVLISLAAALSLAVFLVVFAARSRPTDWLFFCAATAAAPFLFHALSIWPGRHFRQGRDEGNRRVAVADVHATRMAGWVLFAALSVAYICASYFLISGPGEDIFPDSLERTLEAFSRNAGSVCPVVDDTLRLATQIDGFSWYFVTTAATAAWIHDGMALLLWFGFFLKVAMVFGGFVRGLEGSIFLALRLLQRSS